MRTTLIRLRDVPYEEGPGKCPGNANWSPEDRAEQEKVWKRFRGSVVEIIAAPMKYEHVTCPGPFFALANALPPTPQAPLGYGRILCPHMAEID